MAGGPLHDTEQSASVSHGVTLSSQVPVDFTLPVSVPDGAWVVNLTKLLVQQSHVGTVVVVVDEVVVVVTSTVVVVVVEVVVVVTSSSVVVVVEEVVVVVSSPSVVVVVDEVVVVVSSTPVVVVDDVVVVVMVVVVAIVVVVTTVVEVARVVVVVVVGWVVVVVAMVVVVTCTVVDVVVLAGVVLVVVARVVLVVVTGGCVVVVVPPSHGSLLGLHTSVNFSRSFRPSFVRVPTVILHFPSLSPFLLVRTVMFASLPQTAEVPAGVTWSLPTGPQGPLARTFFLMSPASQLPSAWLRHSRSGNVHFLPVVVSHSTTLSASASPWS